MLFKTLLLFSILFASCRVKPFLYPRKDGTVFASLGGSLMVKSAEEGGSLELANGTKMSYYIKDNDETVIPGKYIDYKTIVGLADAANTGEATREKGETIRHGQDASVEKAKSADNVKVKTFVPPEEP